MYTTPQNPNATLQLLFTTLRKTFLNFTLANTRLCKTIQIPRFTKKTDTTPYTTM